MLIWRAENGLISQDYDKEEIFTRAIVTTYCCKKFAHICCFVIRFTMLQRDRQFSFQYVATKKKDFSFAASSNVKLDCHANERYSNTVKRSYCSNALIAKPGISPYSNAYKKRTLIIKIDYIGNKRHATY